MLRIKIEERDNGFDVYWEGDSFFDQRKTLKDGHALDHAQSGHEVHETLESLLMRLKELLP